MHVAIQSDIRMGAVFVLSCTVPLKIYPVIASDGAVFVDVSRGLTGSDGVRAPHTRADIIDRIDRRSRRLRCRGL